MVYTFDLRAQATHSFQRGLSHLRHWLLPARCLACGSNPGIADEPDDSLDLCPACIAQLPLNHFPCRHCALPLTGAIANLICGRCLQNPPRYHQSFCAYEYAYPLQHLIRRFKYGGALAASRVLSHLLADYLRERHSEPWPDCFIPVPLHASRFRSRGYNQVIELGRFLEQALHIPMRLDLIERRRATAIQAGLSRRERRKNLRQAFITTDMPLPKHVALLDDVVTTGSTMNELAHTLSKAGVKTIEVWGVARAAIKLK